MSYLPAQLIRKKRFKGSHSQDELEFLIKGYTSGSIPDYQMSAWLMAVCLSGMTDQETSWLTLAMRNSGKQLDFSQLKTKAIDKHSTGGVGDKTSLIIAPLVAAAGVPVPMMAGRGLGHTGGTLDKLEAIPGFNVKLSLDRFQKLVGEIGTAIIGQTDEICPADLKLYALRDVTGTVDSIPLICASIMSKKLAEGVGGLILDVKFGSGAFMKTLPDAVSLAKGLVNIGHHAGISISALLTQMDQPLGRYIGNACEVKECLEIMDGSYLKTAKPSLYEDTKELSLALASHMLLLSETFDDISLARNKVNSLLSSGEALSKFTEICSRQNGQLDQFTTQAKFETVIEASSDGILKSFNVEEIGLAGIELGAGRRRSEDLIDHSAGIEIFFKLGDMVERGNPLFRIFANSEKGFAAARHRLLAATKIGEGPVQTEPLIAGVVTPEGVFYAH